MTAMAQKLSAIEVKLSRKVGEQNKLFGSVTSKDIHEQLVDQGYQVERKQIHLPEPLKEVGHARGGGEAPRRRDRQGEGDHRTRGLSRGGRKPCLRGCCRKAGAPRCPLRRAGVCSTLAMRILLALVCAAGALRAAPHQKAARARCAGPDATRGAAARHDDVAPPQAPAAAPAQPRPPPPVPPRRFGRFDLDMPFAQVRALPDLADCARALAPTTGTRGLHAAARPRQPRPRPARLGREARRPGADGAAADLRSADSRPR